MGKRKRIMGSIRSARKEGIGVLALERKFGKEGKREEGGGTSPWKGKTFATFHLNQLRFFFNFATARCSRLVQPLGTKS